MESKSAWSLTLSPFTATVLKAHDFGVVVASKKAGNEMRLSIDAALGAGPAILIKGDWAARLATKTGSALLREMGVAEGAAGGTLSSSCVKSSNCRQLRSRLPSES